MTYLPFLSNHTARKPWRCDAGFTCLVKHTNVAAPIAVGERYTAEVYPPWTLTQEDPDSRPGPLGEWVTRRFHVECYGGPW